MIKIITVRTKLKSKEMIKSMTKTKQGRRHWIDLDSVKIYRSRIILYVVIL